MVCARMIRGRSVSHLLLSANIECPSFLCAFVGCGLIQVCVDGPLLWVRKFLAGKIV